MTTVKQIEEEIEVVTELAGVNRIKRKSAAGRSMLDSFDRKYNALIRTKERLVTELGKEKAKEKAKKEAQSTLFS